MYQNKYFIFKTKYENKLKSQTWKTLLIILTA